MSFKEAQEKEGSTKVRRDSENLKGIDSQDGGNVSSGSQKRKKQQDWQSEISTSEEVGKSQTGSSSVGNQSGVGGQKAGIGQHCEPNNANYTLEVKLERLQFH